MITILDKHGMDLADVAATRSRDRSRQTGAAIVDADGGIVSVGWNDFPRGVCSSIEERHERPAKYKWIEHAERNAVYAAARAGRRTKGGTLYLNWFPCADCARAIIEAGIVRLVCVEPDWDEPRWKDDLIVGRVMLREAGVEIFFMPDRKPPESKA